LESAKAWLKDRSGPDAEFRTGLIASADARRLRAWGLDTNALRQDKAWADWFLRPNGDVRSSNQLEVPASNFDCQGLELDWACVCWGNDLLLDPLGTGWRVRQFRGSQWMRANAQKSRYTLNSYRVLLTRARRGQIIWVPQPIPGDETLEPEFFEGVANFLVRAGAQSID
jgi:hypothetical protein